MFHCSLNQSTSRVAIQPGDILGLELPPGTSDDVRLAFAGVSSGPSNYVFTSELADSMYSGALFRHNWVVWELPQITLEIGSGKYIDSNQHYCT